MNASILFIELIQTYIHAPENSYTKEEVLQLTGPDR